VGFSETWWVWVEQMPRGRGTKGAAPRRGLLIESSEGDECGGLDKDGEMRALIGQGG